MLETIVLNKTINGVRNNSFKKRLIKGLQVQNIETVAFWELLVKFEQNRNDHTHLPHTSST